MKSGLHHFERLYGTLLLDNQDAAKWVFLSGWNSAIEEMMDRINKMPLETDTKASFNVYLQGMMHIDPNLDA
jgi:hypothetical protein